MKAKIRTIAGGLLAALVLALVVLNWKLFADRSDINLLLGRVDAPIGLVLLLIVVALIGLQIVLLRAQRLLHDRRHSKEIERIRAAAEDKARSQTDATRDALHREFDTIRSQLERIDQMLSAAPTERSS